jgi:hypothetical protein
VSICVVAGNVADSFVQRISLDGISECIPLADLEYQAHEVLKMEKGRRLSMVR